MRIEGARHTSPIERTRPVNQGIEQQSQQFDMETSNNKKKHVKENTGEERKFTEEEIIGAIEAANNKIQSYNSTKLEFSIHEKTKEIMVKIIDTENDEVIKEIPPEKILDMVANLMELAGIIVDEKV